MVSKLALIVTLTAVLAAASLWMSPVSAASQTSIGFDHDGGSADINPGPIVANVGDFVTVGLVLEVEDGLSVGALTADVGFSDLILDAVSCSAYSEPSGGAACNPDFDTTVARFAGADATGISGAFTVMDVTFEVIGPPGLCSELGVLVGTLTIVDPISNPIDNYILPRGMICVAGSAGRIGIDHDGGAPDINAGPAQVAAGSAVSVGVVADLPPLGLKAWGLNVTFDPAVLDATACASHPSGVCNPDYAGDKARSVGADIGGIFGIQTLSGFTFQAVGGPGSCSDLVITLGNYGTVAGLAARFIQYNPQVFNGRVCITDACADVTGDGRVRLADVILIALRALRGRYDARFDLNGDGVISREDVRIAIGQLGRRC